MAFYTRTEEREQHIAMLAKVPKGPDGWVTGFSHLFNVRLKKEPNKEGFTFAAIESREVRVIVEALQFISQGDFFLMWFLHSA